MKHQIVEKNNKLIDNAVNLKNLFKYIKNDDLKSLLILFEEAPNLVFFKNKQKENLLFYSLQKGSYNISDYLITHHENFLYEKNRYSLTPFSNLIYTNNLEGLEGLALLQQNHLQAIDSAYQINGEQYNIPLLATLKLNEKSWIPFTKLTSHLWKNSNLNLVNNEGHNIAHLIAKRNASFALNILEQADPQIFTVKDLNLGNTPLLTASYFADIDIFNYYLPYSDSNTLNYMGNHFYHCLASNVIINNLSTVLETNMSPLVYNFSNDSALLTAINYKNDHHIDLLLPFYANIDISEEIMLLIKKNPKNNELVEHFLTQLEPQQFLTLSKNSNQISQLFNYIFLNFNEDQFLNLQQYPIWNLIELFDNPIDLHSYYTSTIMGKKSMHSKIEYLHNVGNFLSVEESENLFRPIVNNNELFFENLKESNKLQKSFCFVAALGTLPVSQINNILLKTNLLKYFSQGDLILLHSIAIKKNSSSLLCYCNTNISNNIIRKSNLDWAVQDNLKHFTSNKINMETMQNAFKYVINLFTHPPLHFIEHISEEITNSNKDMLYLKNLFSILNKTEFKKEMTTKIVQQMLTREENLPVLESLFSNNPNLINYFIKHINIDTANNLKENNFLNLILKNYSKTYSSLNLGFTLIQSNNINKNQLFESILHYNEPLETKLNKNNIEKSLLNSLEDATWRKVFNYFYGNKEYSNLIDLYFEYQTKYIQNMNLETIEIGSKFCKNINLNKVVHNLSLNQQLSSEDFNKINTILNVINVNQDSNLYSNLAIAALNQGNFSLLQFLVDQYDIELETIGLDNYWNNNSLSQEFSLDNLSSYLPLDTYLKFIEIHKEKFSIQFWEKNTYNFYNWLHQHSCDSNTKIQIVSKFFMAIEDYVYQLPDEIIINICINVLKKSNEEENLFINKYFENTHKDDMENMLDILLNNKENKFFIQFNESLMKSDIAELPGKHQKRLKYYLLNQSLEHIGNNNTPETRKKKI